MVRIYYGTINKNIEVTKVVFEKCIKNNIIYISGNCDERDRLFTDPVPGINKYVFFELSKGVTDEHRILKIFYRDENVYYDAATGCFYKDNVPELIRRRENPHIYQNTEQENRILQNYLHNEIIIPKQRPNITSRDINLDNIFRLRSTQEYLKLDFGSFYENLSMQLMIMKYLKGNEKVLEIGGNIGRCSLIIASILNTKSNSDFVSIETNPIYEKQLIHNRDQNKLKFTIDRSTISLHHIIQVDDKTMMSDVLLDGFFNVPIATWDQIIEKHGIKFDTLVIDCNDAFYDMLNDFIAMLCNINLIIMKNEYYDTFKKMKVEKNLINCNFILEYSEPGGDCPCYYSYYEVWKRQ
jgi:FkbM family methyltransferase